MNYRAIGTFVGNALKIEAILLLLPFFTGIIYHESQALYYLLTAFITFAISILLCLKKEENPTYHAKEGFVAVGLTWVVMSLLGAVPFAITKEIPSFLDALFETISGFTTTGASIVPAPESLTNTANIWRCLTHWIGGMGVIVFMLAIFPSNSGNGMHLMRAESPGPQVGKFVPKIKETAKMLYIIYIIITLAEIITLCIVGMPLYDAICAGFGSAGTGGFGIKNDSMASYSITIQVVVTIFILLFGVNFNVYYFLLRGKNKKDILKNEELRWYFIITIAAIIIISMNARNHFASYGSAIQQSSFQVASILTTTGYTTTDFNIWPSLSKAILVLLMFIGACAGSTGGGIKVSRIVLTFKIIFKEIHHYIHPNEVKTIKMDGKKIDNETLLSIGGYMLIYLLVLVVSVILVSIDEVDLTSSFTAVAATLNNIGPGLNIVGPTSNYSSLSAFSKIILMFDMLAGRLELLPILLMLSPNTYKKL